MQVLNIAKVCKVILFGIAVLFFCSDSESLLDFCYDLFCMSESEELVLSDLDFLTHLFFIFICNTWLAVISDDNQQWLSVWLYYVYIRLKIVSIVSLTILLQFAILFQRYLSYLNGYRAINNFQDSIQEESSFCLPFV